ADAGRTEPHRRGDQHAAGPHDLVRGRLAIVTLALSCSAMLPLAACAHHYKFPPAQAPSVGTVEVGVASWYGPGYDGKRTASGERLDQDDLTAAHPSWQFGAGTRPSSGEPVAPDDLAAPHASCQFGTRVRVPFLSTGRSVVVRINDRFPN